MTPHQKIRASNQVTTWLYEGDLNIHPTFKDGGITLRVPTSYGDEDVTFSVRDLKEILSGVFEEEAFSDETMEAVRAEINSAIQTWEADGLPRGRILNRSPKTVTRGSMFTGYGSAEQWFARIRVSEITPKYEDGRLVREYHPGELIEVPCRIPQGRV